MRISLAMQKVSILSAAFIVCSVSGFAQQLVNGPLVVLLGPPGSGKSTQAAAVSKHLKVPVVSVEQLIQENAAEIQKTRTRGITGMEPQTDPILNKFFRARLEKGDVSKGMVLDGYPNTKDHADFASKLAETGVIRNPW